MEVRKALNIWLDAKSTVWQQRSRNSWIQVSFMPKRPTASREMSSVGYVMKSVIGRRMTKLQSYRVDYSELFLNGFQVQWTEHRAVVDAIQPRVSEATNVSLLQPVTPKEVSRALTQMHPKNTSGPDSMPHLFYQHCWSLVGNCVTKTVLDFFNHGIFPPNFNETYIVFIPKAKNPTRITLYKHISLNNVVSRLASKVLANRLKRWSYILLVRTRVLLCLIA